MFVQLKRYFYLYKKDILPFIIFLCFFLLVVTVFVKFCLIDTGIINIIDSTKINIPVEASLNSDKVIENQKKMLTTNSNKDLPMYKTPIGIFTLIIVGSTAAYIVITVIAEYISEALK